MLAGLDAPTIIADVGQHHGADPLPAVVRLAATVLVVHRQDPASPGASAVRLERLVEVVDQLTAVAGSVVLGVVGDEPFDLDEIVDLVQSNTSTQLAFAHPIAHGPVVGAGAGRPPRGVGKAPGPPPTGAIDQRTGRPVVADEPRHSAAGRPRRRRHA